MLTFWVLACAQESKAKESIAALKGEVAHLQVRLLTV